MEKQKPKDSVLKNIIRYSSSHAYRQLLAVFTAFIRPKLLRPELYGLWNLLKLIPDYATHFHLGSRYSMRFLIPFYEGNKESEKSKAIKNSFFYGSLALNLLTAFILLYFFFKSSLTPEVRWGLFTMAFMVMLGWYYEYYINLLKAYQNFRLISSSNYLKATVTFILSILLIYFFRIYGVYLSASLSLLTVIIYLHLKYPLEPRAKFDYILFYDLVKKGFPILIFSLIDIFIRTSDRFIISFFLGNKQLGYYGIAILIFNFLMQIPGISREVIEPKLMEELSQKSKEENLAEYFLKPVMVTGYLIPFLIGPVFFILPLFIPLVLPKYIPGIIPTQIIIIGSYFLSMTYVARGIIVAHKWQVKASLVMSLSLLSNIILSILFIKLGLSIRGVALGSSISFFLLFLILFCFIKKRCNYAKQLWKEVIEGLCWPFPIMCLSLFILNYGSKYLSLPPYISPFIKSAIFCIIMLLVVSIGQKKYTFLKGIQIKKL